MPDNPFTNPALAAMTGPLAQAWQSTLDAWWKALLEDRSRLGDLAKHLGNAGLGATAEANGGTSAEDLARIIEALELMQQRQENLEQRLEKLAGTVETMVTYLEKQSE